MVGGPVRGPEDVVLEDIPPRTLLVFGTIAHRPDGVVESIHGRRYELRRRRPPVVDQRVECAEALDVVPPHAWNKHSIPRFHLRDLRSAERIAKAGMLVEIR